MTIPAALDGLDRELAGLAGVRGRAVLLLHGRLGDDVPRLVLDARPAAPVDLVLVTGGGSPTAAARVAALLPDPLTVLVPDGVDLSGGQWQRIALARAFHRDAPLVILDEPTAALDAVAEAELFDRVRDLFAGRTVLIVSHRFCTVRGADRIVVLERGRVAETGDHDTLLAAGGPYARMLRLQAAAYLSPTGPG